MYKLVRNCLNDADKTELNNLSNNFIFLIFYIHQVLLIKSTKTLHSSGIFQSSTLGHIQTMGTFLILLFSYTYKKKLSSMNTAYDGHENALLWYLNGFSGTYEISMNLCV